MLLDQFRQNRRERYAAEIAAICHSYLDPDQDFELAPRCSVCQRTFDRADRRVECVDLDRQ
jgi:hypothetical protein